MIELTLWNNKIELETKEDLFSPNRADRGTLAMLKYVELSKEDKVLDLGCGYGLVGIAVAKVIGPKNVYMVDINKTAVEITKANILENDLKGINLRCGDGLSALKEKAFTLILSNPPYHSDFKVAKSFIEQGFRQMAINGKFIMVVKRVDWYKNKLISVFGGVKIIEDDGYYILIAEKRSDKVIKKVQLRKTNKKHEKRTKK